MRILYLDVLLVTQPSVLKHWKEHKALTLNSGLMISSSLHPTLDSWDGKSIAAFSPVEQYQYHFHNTYYLAEMCQTIKTSMCC